MKRWLIAGLGALVLAACTDGGDVTAPAPQFDAGSGAAIRGNVYTATNDANGNAILMYTRGADGSLTYGGTYATGGTGTGSGLGNQGGVVLDGNVLLAVNAGSNEISAFLVDPDGSLALTDHVASGGTMPISVTRFANTVYVLNAGGAGNISGFRLQEGSLTPIPGSTRSLSGPGTGPAQIQFSPNGRLLVVTEKAANAIVTYAMHGDLAGPPVSHPSIGVTPFGFDITQAGVVVVSDAVGGAAGAGTVSSYALSSQGDVTPVTPAVPDQQGAPCWIVITRNGRYAYTTNATSASISGYRVDPDGSLTLLDAGGVTASTDAGPIDEALTRGGQQYLYALNSGGVSITAYAVGGDGSLAPVAGGHVAGLPAGTNGLAAR